MKSIILSGIFLLAIGLTNSQASGIYAKNNPKTAKKSTTVVRNILSDKLPSNLLKSIKKNYKNYWITELYKEVANGKASYHITVENADQTVKLIANPPTNWTVKHSFLKDPEMS
jgi:ectoine hydroxylase-related dioxygenase (phytanoyl-CoA dioxygenase family)